MIYVVLLFFQQVFYVVLWYVAVQNGFSSDALFPKILFGDFCYKHVYIVAVVIQEYGHCLNLSFARFADGCETFVIFLKRREYFL